LGAGAGTAGAAATGKKDIEFPAETRLAFQDASRGQRELECKKEEKRVSSALRLFFRV